MARQAGCWHAPGGEDVDEAVRTVGMCFKAKDLNLVRASQFIEYSRPGVGENCAESF